MRRTLAAFLTLVIGLQPALLLAQQPVADKRQLPSEAPQTASTQPSQPAQAQPPATTSAPQPAQSAVPDIDALGISFDRIKRLLADRAPTENKSGLKLNYYVEVVALAPTIQLFTREDLSPRGVIPWGAPTHADIVRLLTPVEFRSPRVDVGSLAILGIMKLAQWEAARMKRHKAEEERRKRNEEERRRQKALEESGLVIIKSSK